jgi:hypothetical protein
MGLGSCWELADGGGGPISNYLFSRILETGPPHDQDNCTSAWENNEHRDITLQPELDSVPSTTANVFAQTVPRMSKYGSVGLKNIARTIPERRLGITDKSYAGLVPTSTRRSDKVCILHNI